MSISRSWGACSASARSSCAAPAAASNQCGGLAIRWCSAATSPLPDLVTRSRSNIAAIHRATSGETAARRGAALSIGLSAVIVAASVQEPRVLTIRLPAAHPERQEGVQDMVEALPSGPLEAEHRTLEIGLRAWVERQTG